MIKKELEKITKISSNDYENLQEYYSELMNFINDEGEEFFKSLSDNAQKWFNDNVDRISEGEELIGFDGSVPEEVTEEVEFDEVVTEEETEDDNEEEVNLEDYQEITLEDVKEEQRLLIILDDETGVEGIVTKKLKVAIKILTDEEKEMKVINRKISAIYLYTGSEDKVSDVDEETIEETPVNENSELVKTKTSINLADHKEEVAEAIVESVNESLKKEYSNNLVNVEEKTIEKSVCNCKTTNNAAMKAVLHHISEIFRIISDEM